MSTAAAGKARRDRRRAIALTPTLRTINSAYVSGSGA